MGHVEIKTTREQFEKCFDTYLDHVEQHPHIIINIDDDVVLMNYDEYERLNGRRTTSIQD